jgi:hypothetical protein
MQTIGPGGDHDTDAPSGQWMMGWAVPIGLLIGVLVGVLTG